MEKREQWSLAKRFTDAPSGVTVDVSRADTDRGPRYSVRVGRLLPLTPDQARLREEERGPAQLGPFIPAMRDRSSIAHVRLLHSFAEPMARLSADAEEWIVTEMAQHNEEYLEERREKEHRQAAFGKAPTKVTGKTAKKREKERTRTQKSA